MSFAYQPREVLAPGTEPLTDLGKLRGQVALTHLVNEFGPMVLDWILGRQADASNEPATRTPVATRAELGQLRTLVQPQRSERPAIIPTAQTAPDATQHTEEQPETSKTQEELAMTEDLKRRGYVLDEPTGNYLDPTIFDIDQLRNDPLLPYTFYDESNTPVTCRFRESFGDRLQRADENMWRATGKRLIIISAFRSNRKQRKINDDPTVMTKAPVGRSQHEAGLAADIANWEEAQDFLADVGIYGGKYKNLVSDRWHFDNRHTA